MSFSDSSAHRSLAEFLDQTGIDPDSDIDGRPYLIPKLFVQDEAGATTSLISDSGGTNYRFTQLDYVNRHSGLVVANRMVAEITPGNRTDLAYWAEDAPAKQLTVHRGLGSLVLCSPKVGAVVSEALDATMLNRVVLQSGSFYTIRAATAASESLVVSGYYEPPADWSAFEVDFQPNERVVSIGSEGTVMVPEAFLAQLLE